MKLLNQIQPIKSFSFSRFQDFTAHSFQTVYSAHHKGNKIAEEFSRNVSSYDNHKAHYYVKSVDFQLLKFHVRIWVRL